jgi:hypothetical protein
MPLNWMGVDTPASKEAMLTYLESIHSTVMTPDTVPVSGTNIGYTCTPGANYAPSHVPCVLLGITTADHHNFCGEIASMPAVEDSETGYNSVAPGDLTAAEVLASWNADTCASHGVWDYPGGPTAPWSDELTQINLHPQLTHNTKPSSYP